MQVILIAVLTFGLLFLVDKGFTRIFRSQAQHQSGLAVRLPKLYATAGIILSVLAVLAVIAGINESSPLLIGGGLFIAVLGLGLILYYISFGVFYDEESFIFTTFGKKSVTYYFRDILGQQLYVVTGGSVIVELHMGDGRAVSLQSKMEGVYPFLDKAFYGWCRQKGIDPASCDFHDTDNSCWFPNVEG